MKVVADTHTAAGTICAATASALMTEVRHRVARGRFFGHIAYTSLLALKRAGHG
jgi:hypothetical protein